MKLVNEGGITRAEMGTIGSEGEGNVPVDCCATDTDETPLPDRALEADAYTVNTPTSGGIVQIKAGAWHASGGSFTDNYDATPTNGNTLLAFLWAEGSTTRVVDSSGWSLIETGTIQSTDAVKLYSKVAGSSEPTAVHVPAGAGGSASRLVLYEVAGSYDVSDSLSEQAITSPLTAATLTPGSDPAVLIAAFFSKVATYAGDPTQTPQGSLTTDSFSRRTGARAVAWVGNETTSTGSYTPQLATTGLYAGTKTASIDVVIDATPTDVEWNVPVPNTVDGDDATYHEIDGPDVIRVDLGGPFRIVHSRLLIGCDDAGSKTYTIKGANEADLSDAVTLASATFTSTGSFATNDVDFTWTTADSFRYFELTGPDETRRVFSWELYEADASTGQDHTHPDLEDEISDNSAAIDDHISDTTDAHDASAISIEDAGNYFTGTDVEAALQELGAGGGGGVTFGTPAIVLGTAAANGSIAEAIRRDSTIVAFDATSPTTQAFDDTAATGAAAVAARRDHKHAMPTAAITTSGLTQATSKLLGRTSASTGAIEEISAGSGLSLSGGTLTATGVGPGGNPDDENNIVANEVFG